MGYASEALRLAGLVGRSVTVTTYSPDPLNAMPINPVTAAQGTVSKVRTFPSNSAGGGFMIELTFLLGGKFTVEELDMFVSFTVA